MGGHRAGGTRVRPRGDPRRVRNPPRGRRARSAWGSPPRAQPAARATRRAVGGAVWGATRGGGAGPVRGGSRARIGPRQSAERLRGWTPPERGPFRGCRGIVATHPRVVGAARRLPRRRRRPPPLRRASRCGPWWGGGAALVRQAAGGRPSTARTTGSARGCAPATRRPAGMRRRLSIDGGRRRQRSKRMHARPALLGQWVARRKTRGGRWRRASAGDGAWSFAAPVVVHPRSFDGCPPRTRQRLALLINFLFLLYHPPVIFARCAGHPTPAARVYMAPCGGGRESPRRAPDSAPQAETGAG